VTFACDVRARGSFGGGSYSPLVAVQADRARSTKTWEVNTTLASRLLPLNTPHTTDLCILPHPFVVLENTFQPIRDTNYTAKMLLDEDPASVRSPSTNPPRG